MAESSWSAWMVAGQDGDAGPYHSLLNEVSAWLGRYFSRRLPPAMIEDAVQNTLLALHLKRHTYDPSRPFGPWLAAFARHKWIDKLRSMRFAATEILSDNLSVGDHEAAVTSAYSLERLLLELKPAQSEVIRLVKLQGFSIEEAALRTGQSNSLVKVNIHRGLGRLAAIVRGQTDAVNTLVQRLTAYLRPVRRRSITHDALVLGLAGVAEVALFLWLGFMRHDLSAGNGQPSFWWKLASMGLIALLGGAVALLSFSPTGSPRSGLRWLALMLALCLAAAGAPTSRETAYRCLPRD